MNKKYFDTKTGSLEDAIVKVAAEQPTIKKQEPNVKLKVEKTYFDVKPGSVSDAAAKVVSEGFIKEGTYAFDYDFTLSMPSYKVTGDGDSFKEYEGTIKATGKDAAEAKEKAEKELQKRIDAAEKSTKGSLEDPFNSILQQGKAVSEEMDPVNKDAVKKKFADRKDKDIDNDGDVDSSDKFLHKRRKAISKAMKEDLGKEDEPKVKEIVGKLKKASAAHAAQSKALDKAVNEAMSPAQIKKLKDSWADIKLMSPEKVKTLKNFLDKYSTDTLMQLAQSGINFVSNMARSVAMRRKSGDPRHAGSMKEEKGVPKGYHKMPDGSIMKDSEHKKESKTFSDLRNETKVIKLGDKGKTATGKNAASVDVEPSSKPI